VVVALPARLSLDRNYPNPFNPSTTIGYDLPAPGPTTLTIYCARGQRVVCLKDGFQPAGLHEIQWEGRDSLGREVPSGSYIVRLGTDQGVCSRKLVLAR